MHSAGGMTGQQDVSMYRNQYRQWPLPPRPSYNDQPPARHIAPFSGTSTTRADFRRYAKDPPEAGMPSLAYPAYKEDQVRLTINGTNYAEKAAFRSNSSYRDDYREIPLPARDKRPMALFKSRSMAFIGRPTSRDYQAYPLPMTPDPAPIAKLSRNTSAIINSTSDPDTSVESWQSSNRDDYRFVARQAAPAAPASRTYKPNGIPFTAQSTSRSDFKCPPFAYVNYHHPERVNHDVSLSTTVPDELQFGGTNCKFDSTSLYRTDYREIPLDAQRTSNAGSEYIPDAPIAFEGTSESRASFSMQPMSPQVPPSTAARYATLDQDHISSVFEGISEQRASYVPLDLTRAPATDNSNYLADPPIPFEGTSESRASFPLYAATEIDIVPKRARQQFEDPRHNQMVHADESQLNLFSDKFDACSTNQTDYVVHPFCMALRKDAAPERDNYTPFEGTSTSRSDYLAPPLTDSYHMIMRRPSMEMLQQQQLERAASNESLRHVCDGTSESRASYVAMPLALARPVLRQSAGDYSRVPLHFEGQSTSRSDFGIPEKFTFDQQQQLSGNAASQNAHHTHYERMPFDGVSNYQSDFIAPTQEDLQQQHVRVGRYTGLVQRSPLRFEAVTESRANYTTTDWPKMPSNNNTSHCQRQQQQERSDGGMRTPRRVFERPCLSLPFDGISESKAEYTLQSSPKEAIRKQKYIDPTYTVFEGTTESRDQYTILK